MLHYLKLKSYPWHYNTILFRLPVELELLSNNGFGQLKSVQGHAGKRMIFYKISGTMVDPDIANHVNILKSAEMTTEQYTQIFNNASRTNQGLLMQHPYIEEFRDNLNTPVWNVSNGDRQISSLHVTCKPCPPVYLPT